MDLKERINLIKKPERIKDALYANSATVLGFAFEEDANIRALINAGNKVIPLLEKEIKQHAFELHEITLSSYAFILTKIDVQAASKILRSIFPKIIKRPGSFAAIFIAYALRKDKGLSVNPLKMFFTEDQLHETLRVTNNYYRR